MYLTHLAHAIMYGVTRLGRVVPVYLAVAAVQTVIIGFRARLVRRRERRDLAVLQDWLGESDPD